MFSWITSIFGGFSKSEKTIDLIGDSIRGIGNWIDEKDFTPEEKSKALAKSVDSHLKLVEATNNENSTRSITRRWLAFIIVGWTLLMTTVGIIFALINDVTRANIIFDSVAGMGSNILLISVVGFYFGVQFLRK